MGDEINYWKLFSDSFNFRYTNPQATVGMMRQASALAKQAGDLQYGLYVDHWLLQTLINVTGDYDEALDLAVQTAVEARKRTYREQMERVCVHEDLISAYLGIDPIGHAKLIEDAMTYMERETDSSIECYYCLLSLRANFEITFGATEKATHTIRRYYSETQSYDRHHFGSAHVELCSLMALRGDWERMLPYTLNGIEVTGDNVQMQGNVATLWAARALALRKLNREVEALVAFQRAKAKADLMQIPIYRVYYDMMCDFHLEVGEVEAALILREHQLKDVIGKGQPYWEAVFRLAYARLLKQIGRPYAEQVSQIRQLSMKLKKPEVVLDPLSAFEAEA